MADVHVHYVDVRFGDCDPAGIAYYPRFFDWFHQAMETWFGERLGIPYAELIVEDRRGVPAVHTEADFRAPLPLGERAGIEVRVARLGRTSMALSFRVVGEDGTLRAVGRTDVVMVDLDPSSADHLKPLPIEGDLRARIEAYTREIS